jgi:hypothetical protein
MKTRFLSADDQLLAQLEAPPDLGQGVEALAYWAQRRRRLSWYRIRARREAGRMSTTWEQRVRAALISQRAAPLDLRLSAGLLLARNLLRRWSRRAVIALSALLVAAVVVAPLVASVAWLAHVL